MRGHPRRTAARATTEPDTRWVTYPNALHHQRRNRLLAWWRTRTRRICSPRSEEQPLGAQTIQSPVSLLTRPRPSPRHLDQPDDQPEPSPTRLCLSHVGVELEPLAAQSALNDSQYKALTRSGLISSTRARLRGCGLQCGEDPHHQQQDYLLEVFWLTLLFVLPTGSVAHREPLRVLVARAKPINSISRWPSRL